MSLEDLLYGLMIPSGNDAANAIAVHVGGSIEGFVSMMNQEVARLGATGTHFVNANGLTDPDHYTTAYDLYLMFHEALSYDTFRTIIGTHDHTAVYMGSDGSQKTASWTVGNYYMNGKAETPEGLGGLWRKDRDNKGGRVLSYYGDQDRGWERIRLCDHGSRQPGAPL